MKSNLDSADATLTANGVPHELSGGASVAHTPGPWEVADSLDGFHTIDPARGSCAYGRNIAVASDVRTKDAARIVACVNFCEGVPETMLASCGSLASVRKQRDEAADKYLALRSRVDELEAALRLCQRAILGQRTTGEAMVAAEAALNRSTDK